MLTLDHVHSLLLVLRDQYPLLLQRIPLLALLVRLLYCYYMRVVGGRTSTTSPITPTELF
jgi:hypothetical protein